MHVEAHIERSEIEVLLAAQRSHGEATDRIEVFAVGSADDGFAINVDTGTGKIIARDIGDVVAAIAIGRPAFGIRCQSTRTRLHAERKVFDLYARIVVIELAHYVPPAGIE